jgi:hypothetical protein
MLEFKKYLKEVKNDYSEEEINNYKLRVDKIKETLNEQQQQKMLIDNEMNSLIKEKKRIEEIFQLINDK